MNFPVGRSAKSNYAAIQLAGFVIVSLTMVEMFTIPQNYFVLGSIVSTSSMICVAVFLIGIPGVRKNPTTKGLLVGIAVSFLLY